MRQRRRLDTAVELQYATAFQGVVDDEVPRFYQRGERGSCASSGGVNGYAV